MYYRRKFMGVHDGHRSRMYEKLFNAPASLEDHELLEILLFSVLPRVNTNPIAHELLDRFGSLDAIFDATLAQVTRIEGVGGKTAEFLISVGAVLKRINASHSDMPRIFSSSQFGDYVAKKYAPLKKEVFDIYFIDKANSIRGSHRIESDLCDRVTIDVKDLTEVIAASKAAGIILVHNHIHGAPNPSAEDDEVTQNCMLICRFCGMRLYDHFIYGKDWVYSYFTTGRIDTLKPYASSLIKEH